MKPSWPCARLRAERKVGDHHHECVMAFAEAGEQRTAAGNPARQRVIDHFGRLQPADQAVRRMRQAHHRPVRLVAPERHAGGFGEVTGLVEEARAQAARVGFLQADHVEAAEQFGEGIEVVELVAPRQHRVDAARDVVAVTLHAGTGEDVAAEQPQAALRCVLDGGDRAGHGLDGARLVRFSQAHEVTGRRKTGPSMPTPV